MPTIPQIAITTLTSAPTETRAPLAADALIPRIRDAHRLCRATASRALDHALEAGRLLLDAKAHLLHGAWGSWLRDQCQIPERTAQAYMRVARELAGSNPQRVADLSLRGVLHALATPRDALPAAADSDDALVREIIDDLMHWETTKARIERMSLPRLAGFIKDGDAQLAEIQRGRVFFESLLAREARLGFAPGEFFGHLVRLAEERIAELERGSAFPDAREL